MEAEPTLEEYESGIWYDTHNGDFCEIQSAFNPEGKFDGIVVELVEPETGFVYHDMPLAEWKDYERYEFRQVSHKAENDPAAYVCAIMESLIGGEKKLAVDESISLEWAYKQVNIVEE